MLKGGRATDHGVEIPQQRKHGVTANPDKTAKIRTNQQCFPTTNNSVTVKNPYEPAKVLIYKRPFTNTAEMPTRTNQTMTITSQRYSVITVIVIVISTNQRRDVIASY